ncbi:hypothetical protein GN956_G25514 [Arapaima gigas]
MINSQNPMTTTSAPSTTGSPPTTVIYAAHNSVRSFASGRFFDLRNVFLMQSPTLLKPWGWLWDLVSACLLAVIITILTRMLCS